MDKTPSDLGNGFPTDDEAEIPSYALGKTTQMSARYSYLPKSYADDHTDGEDGDL